MAVDANGTDGATVVGGTDGGAADGILIPLLADDEDGTTVDSRISVDDITDVPFDEGLVDSADGAAAVDNGILIPLLVDDADGATVNGRILVNEGLVDSADGAAVDDGIFTPMLADDADGAIVGGRISVDDTKGVVVDEGISVGGEEYEVLVLVPGGGGVVDASALALTAVPVEAGTC
jgi:hypothetical protein